MPTARRYTWRAGARTLSPAQMMEARLLRSRGWPLKKLAKRYSVSHTTMGYALSASGLGRGTIVDHEGADSAPPLLTRERTTWDRADIARRAGLSLVPRTPSKEDRLRSLAARWRAEYEALRSRHGSYGARGQALHEAELDLLAVLAEVTR